MADVAAGAEAAVAMWQEGDSLTRREAELADVAPTVVTDQQSEDIDQPEQPADAEPFTRADFEGALRKVSKKQAPSRYQHNSAGHSICPHCGFESVTERGTKIHIGRMHQEETTPPKLTAKELWERSHGPNLPYPGTVA